LFRIDFHVSGYLNFDKKKKNSICSLKFSILLFMETALKRLIFHKCHFSNVWSWSIRQNFRQYLKLSQSCPCKYKTTTKNYCHFYRVFSQDQLKWMFYLSPTAYAQSGHWWLLQKKFSNIFLVTLQIRQRFKTINWE